jgi:ribosomal protein S18 acetylase RimI-like enzyme
MLRPFESSDEEILINIFKLNVPKYFDPKELNDFKKYLKSNGTKYLVIEIENRIIGGVGYEIRNSDRSGRINWIFFHHNFIGEGYGRKAVEECLKILKNAPAVDVLKVRTSQLAYKFFERLGYKITYTEKNYWGTGLDLYEMEMRRN